MTQVEKCPKHRKPYETVCGWCGTRLCRLCVGRRDGRKSYCEKCAPKLNPLEREHPLKAKTEQPPQEQDSLTIEPYY